MELKMQLVTFRGHSFGREDVARAMERFDRELRAVFKRWHTYAIRHEGRNYPPKQLLRLIVGDIGQLSGGDPTNRYFRDLGYDVVEIGDEEQPEVDTSTDALDTSLSLEIDLENSLAGDLSRLEPGLRIYKEQGLFGRQVDAQAAGRIDILAVDRDEQFVVIELKAGEADRQVCGQVQAYMGWVKQRFPGRSVRGIIVANEFTDRAGLAASVVPGLSLVRYRVTFSFEAVDLTVGGTRGA
ncbi:MAG: endonuclease NucS domain-containing protein [Nitrososphaera sp.]